MTTQKENGRQAVSGAGPIRDDAARASLYDAMLSSFIDFAYIFDLEGRFLYANKPLLDLWGKSPGDEVGKNFFDLNYPPDLAARLQCQIQEVISSGKPLRDETAYTGVAGTTDFYEYVFSPILSGNRIVGVSGITRIVTERKQREAELAELTRQKEEQARLFDATLSSINDLAYTFDLEGNWIYANKPLLKLWGRELHEITGKSSLELNYPPELAERLKAQVKQVVATRQPFKGETFFTDAAGVEDYHEYIFSPVFAPDGTVAAVCGTTRLITQRRRAEQNSLFLNRLGQKLATMSDASQIRRTAVQELGEFLKVNRCYFCEWKWSGESSLLDVKDDWHSADLPGIAGLHDLAHFGPEIWIEQLRHRHLAINDLEAQEIDPGHLQAFRSLQIRAYATSRFLKQDAAVINLAVTTATPRKWHEDELELLESVAARVWPLIERALSDQALRRSQAQLEEHAKTLEMRVDERTAKLQDIIADLESFSYSVSHDLRAPLRAMQSFALILREECGNEVGPVGKDYIRRIVTSAQRMDRLIQDILIFSRVARADLTLEPVDLDKLVRGIIESYPQFHASNADIEITGKLPVVLGNEASLTQCVSNLLGNAVKFMAPHVKPRIRIYSVEQDGVARVSFQDNGIGIEKDYQDRIFGIFQQLDKNFEGTGIGLAIVKKAVERMEGRAGVESEPNKGSNFWLELKLAKA